MSERAESPRKLTNNSIPAAAIWAFGLVLLAVLLALPFLVFKVMALTQNQAQGMSLAGAAGLPVPAGELRCTVRETRDKGRLAARYELTPEQARAVGEKLTETRPTPAFFEALQALSPNETGWQPEAAAAGPWRCATGSGQGYDWAAALDTGSGRLWIHATRRDTK